MVARVRTVAFQGVEVSSIDVQVQIASGLPAFAIVAPFSEIRVAIIAVFARAMMFTQICKLCILAAALGLPTKTFAEPPAASDFASICPQVAALENGGDMDSIAVPFGAIDLNNDGTAEIVGEAIGGSRGVHLLSVERAPGTVEFTTCDGCGDSYKSAVRVVAVAGRNYVIEYSSGLLARLWEARSGEMNQARCWFRPTYRTHLAESADDALCKATMDGAVQRVDFPFLPFNRRPTLPAKPRLEILPSNTSQASHAVSLDLDNDGTIEEVAQFLRTAVGCASATLLAISDAAGMPEDTPRNLALLRAQPLACHSPTYGAILHDGKTYIEGRIPAETPIQAAPRPPFWTIIDFTGGAAREVCRFAFEGAGIEAFPAE
jgi:hypothetical protein